MSPDLLQALRAIHQPRDWADVEAAKRRLAFEELLLLQLKLLLRREIDRTPRSEADLLGTRVTQLDMMEAGRDVLGFRLTAAQDRVLTEVRPAYPWSGLAIKLLCHGCWSRWTWQTAPLLPASTSTPCFHRALGMPSSLSLGLPLAQLAFERSELTVAAVLLGEMLLSCCTCRICVAAFAREVLAGKSTPGVWYPEEPEAVRDRRLLLDLAAKGCDR